MCQSSYMPPGAIINESNDHYEYTIDTILKQNDGQTTTHKLGGGVTPIEKSPIPISASFSRETVAKWQNIHNQAIFPLPPGGIGLAGLDKVPIGSRISVFRRVSDANLVYIKKDQIVRTFGSICFRIPTDSSLAVPLTKAQK